MVLGFLTGGPKTGYDLKELIGASVGHFWTESYGQLYPALRALQEEGHLAVTEEIRNGRLAKVYALQPSGRAELDGWLREPPATETVRNELLLKVFFGSQVPREVTVRHLEGAAREAEELRVVLEGVEAAVRAHPGHDPYMAITLEYGLAAARAQAAWAARAIEALKAR